MTWCLDEDKSQGINKPVVAAKMMNILDILSIYLPNHTPQVRKVLNDLKRVEREASPHMSLMEPQLADGLRSPSDQLVKTRSLSNSYDID